MTHEEKLAERKADREALREVRSWKRQAEKDRETMTPEELDRKFMEIAAKYHLNVIKPQPSRERI
jgi:hypothetical protein